MTGLCHWPRGLATVVVLLLAAMAPPATQADTPATAAPTAVTAATGSEVAEAPPAAAPAAPALDDAAVVDMDRRFNDLRREFLDDRARTLDWWLDATAIFLTLFGVVVAIAGFIGFRRFREIENDARRSATTARNLVREIEEKRDEAASLLKETTAETAAKAPAKVDEATQSVWANPTASPMDRAVAAAIELQRQGNAEGAAGKWRAIAEAMEGVDNDLAARAWFSVGYLRQESEKGDTQGAVDAYDKAIQLKPDMVEAYNNRGNAMQALGRYKEAIVDYDEALRLEPRDADAYNNRGGARCVLGRHEEAIADCDEALRLKPSMAAAHNNRGNAKHDLGRREEAIADYDEAIRLKPDYADAYNNRGVVKSTLGRYKEAIADYNEALRLKPDHAGAYKNRGITHLHLGRKDEARRDFEVARDLARKAGREDLANEVERALKALPDEKEP